MTGKARVSLTVLIILTVVMILAFWLFAFPLNDIFFEKKSAPHLALELSQEPFYSPEEEHFIFIVSASISGNPQPEIAFNRDDSMGALGPYQAMVYLPDGETFSLRAEAKNSIGEVVETIELVARLSDNIEIAVLEDGGIFPFDESEQQPSFDKEQENNQQQADNLNLPDAESEPRPDSAQIPGSDTSPDRQDDDPTEKETAGSDDLEIIQAPVPLGSVDVKSLPEEPSNQLQLPDSFPLPIRKPGLASGSKHIVGLNSDGTVIAAGFNSYGQCNVGEWTDIVQISAGGSHTVGLKSDGTVICAGDNHYGQCEAQPTSRNVGGWSNIIQVTSGLYHTVGLKSNGTIFTTGSNAYGQCSETKGKGWTNLVQVSAGDYFTMGLKANGTVVAMGDNNYGQLNVSGWNNITQVAAGSFHAVGLRSDGTVVVVGDNSYGQCNVTMHTGGWNNIIQVAAGGVHTVGLKSDGTVVYAGYREEHRPLSDWNNIDQIAAGKWHTVGLKNDGSVVYYLSSLAERHAKQQREVRNWTLK
jgi:hypothetical protein